MPDYIARDTYQGPHSRHSNKILSGTFLARELAALSPVGAVFALWEHRGTVNGVALYGRTRFVGQEDGSLHGYDSDGVCKIIHPADRRIRVVTK